MSLPQKCIGFRLFFIYDSRDNDRSSLNCASMLKGGWWWKSCGRGLNGLYLNDPQDLTARQGTFITCYSKHIIEENFVSC